MPDSEQSEHLMLEIEFEEHIHRPKLFTCMGSVLELYKCGSCDYKTCLITNLKEHIRTIHKPDTEIKSKHTFLKINHCCEYCNFETWSHLVFLKHNDKCPVTKPTDSLNHFSCEHCSFKSKTRGNLKQHVSIKHASPREVNDKLSLFQCEQCAYKAKSELNLRRHVLVKHTEAPDPERFGCEHCGYKTNQKYNLKKHVVSMHEVSTSVKWWECQHCFYITTQESNLENHIVAKHADLHIEWFACEHCSYKGTTPYNLNQHIAAKHKPAKDIKRFECEYCLFKSKRRTNLKKHVLVKHTIRKEGEVNGNGVPLKYDLNSVISLIWKPFSQRSYEEKLIVKRLGRPTPELNIVQTVKCARRQFNRNFNVELYKRQKWICGCDTKNALFCFPCLLFGGEKSWTKSGRTDLNHLASRIKHHEISAAHMKNTTLLSFFGNVKIAAQLDTSYKRTVASHNENVKYNRYILNIIINCIRFCGAFELVLRGHDSSPNPGVFRGLINFSAELDDAMKNHLEKASVFKGTSKTIQNEILQIILDVCHQEISKEIKEADFLAVIADETSDVANMFQMVVVYRYIVKAKPVERFWDILTPPKHDPQTLASCVIEELEKHIKNIPNKLIAQTYDGASVMSGSSNGVQAVVKRTYPHAAYVHCYAHQLNFITLRAASVNRNVRIFYADLQEICSFFSTSPQRTSILDGIVKKRLPRSIPTSWNFQSRSVNTVYEYREEIIQCMRMILHGDEITNANTLSQASGQMRTLESESFFYWLSFFNKIMPNVEILFNQLQKKEIDANKYITAFENNILEIRNAIEDPVLLTSEAKRRRLENEDLHREAKEVCDVIICQVKDRFHFTGHLIASTLFLAEKFSEYNFCFPEAKLAATVEAYPFFDRKKLHAELSVLYGMAEFRMISGAMVLFDVITQNNLSETFSECVKLLKILITIPMSAEAERCFSTLKRIKTFLTNTMSQERLSALAMLSKERDFIADIPDFNQKVIEEFARREDRRVDFLFK